MKRSLQQTALLTALLVAAGVSNLVGQLPTLANPADELPSPSVLPVASEPPVVALVESILAGEDDPVAWAALEVALGEGGQARGEDAPSVTGRAETTPDWASVVAWARGYITAVNWTPELLLVLGVFGLLAVAGAGALVGSFRRRPASTRPTNRLGWGGLRPGRRRPARRAGAACRDAARLEARLRHRRAA